MDNPLLLPSISPISGLRDLFPKSKFLAVEKYAWCIYRDKQPNLSKSESAGEGMTFQTTMVIPPSTADLPCGNIPQQFYRHPGTASRSPHAPNFSAVSRSWCPCNLRFPGQSFFPITAYDDCQLERASNAATKTLFIKMLFDPPVC